MLLNPRLYEINTRVWLKQFGKNATLADVPLNYFENLAEKGINLIWLMGIWKTCFDVVDKYCFTPELISSYSKSLENWKNEDVMGSPYSIDEYEINPLLGTRQDLLNLKRNLNDLGMKLILDFVPNHFGAGTRYLDSHPEIFLQADNESLERDSYTFFTHNNKVFAHGRDPVFPAWTDTVQINIFSNAARIFLSDILLNITKYCDGVRCDMSMLPVNNVFFNTWIGIHNKNNGQKPKEEFWKECIKTTRNSSPGFLFIAEVYWGLEWDLLQLGFDFTYDKRLLERLQSNDIIGITAHLRAEESFQQKSVRFIENHDEQRAASSLGKLRSMAAATVITTIMGMKLYYDGQFSGKKIKLALQLCREPEEKFSPSINEYYDHLLKITNENIFKTGKWRLLEPQRVSEDNLTYESILSWQWVLDKQVRLVVINYSNSISQCRLKFNFDTEKNSLVLHDLLNNKKYIRPVEEIRRLGLFIELKAFASHIFSVEL